MIRNFCHLHSHCIRQFINWKLTRSLADVKTHNLHQHSLPVPRYQQHFSLFSRLKTEPQFLSWSINNKNWYCSFTDTMADNRYLVGIAKLGTSSCKKCKQKIEKGVLRIAKVVHNPFTEDGGDMKQWFHPRCIFETLVRARGTTRKIEEPDDVEGFTDLQQEDKDTVNKLIKEFVSTSKTPTKKTPAKPKQEKLAASSTSKPSKPATPIKSEPDTSSSSASDKPGNDSEESERDDAFREFRRLCANIAGENSYTGKTALVSKYLTKGSTGDGFHGNTYLLMKLLMPGVVKSIYNLNNKQLVKLFSQVFGTNLKAMLEDLDQGDVAETVRVFFEENKVLPPQKKSLLSIQEVDSLLEDLSKMTKEDDQQRILTKIAKRCTGNDLKMVVRLIKHDLRINSGAKHILDGLDENAYAAFQASRDLRDVVDRVMANREENGGKPGLGKKLSVRASLMTPVLPMLAEACRSVEQAMKKCPNGFYAEIKYDGERVQLHKKGDQFQYFSRSLKPVLPHKVVHFKEFIPKAFPTGDDLILDAEVLLIDTNTGTPLPFGTLGKHKKEQFSEAKVCLFIFDCLHINGKNIMDRPIKERRKVLRENMTEIPNRILFSEMKHISHVDDLQDLMTRVFQEGLEGLVLKDVNSIYEPGKRHWLKVKKDYLNEGSMADSADLVVLGAFYGTGNKGGMMSVFLMGVYNEIADQWCTVTKVGNGFDDQTLENLQKQLKMVKISKNAGKVPDWLSVKKNMLPDFVVADPKQAPVWEISGAEFSKSDIHTAGGISIRFPRVTKVRDDKNWETATDLKRLKVLFAKSKDTSDLVLPGSKGKSPAKGKAVVKGSKKRSDSDNEGTPGTSNGASSGPVTPHKANGAGNKGDSTPSKSSPLLNYFTPKKEQVTPSKETPSKSLKRSSSSDGAEDVTPSKKARPLCKFGEGCYQKSPTHKETFSHDFSGSKQKTSRGNLHDVFTGSKIYLPSDITEFKKLRRFIIAYDGDLVPDYDQTTATHVIMESNYTGIPVKCAGVCVKSDWLWSCIKRKALVPTEKYVIS